MEDNKSSKIPDPSILTTQQLWREIASLKELTFTRLDAIEMAVRIAHEDMVRVPTEVQKAISTLKELHEEKLSSIQHLMEARRISIDSILAERDAQRLQANHDNKIALDTALAAAKESSGEQIKTQAMAIVKNETAASKQIEALEDKLNDMKDRLTTIEAMSMGSEKMDSTRHNAVNFNAYLIFGIVGIVLSIVGIAIALRR